MSAEEAWNGTVEEESSNSQRRFDRKNGGFDAQTGIYHSLIKLGDHQKIPTRPDLDTATFVLSQFPHPHQSESQIALIDAATDRRVTYAQLHRSIRSLASALYHALGVRKGDVVFVLSPNSLLYPTKCFAVLSVGAALTTANPLNTASEIGKQVRDSGAKLAISAPEELHKLAATGLPTILTSRKSNKDNDSFLSVEELIECCDPPLELPSVAQAQSDTAAILYSSGTTGTSKGVILTHANFIAIIKLLQWSVDVSSANNDVFLCFIPMFHIYGLAFFVLGLLCVGTTTVLMQKFELCLMPLKLTRLRLNRTIYLKIELKLIRLFQKFKLIKNC
jgi:OPC-8:0 CoA ligase-1